MLRLSQEQIESLTERRVEVQRRRVAEYLREVTGGKLSGASNEQVRQHVLHSEATARELGLVTEAGHCRWTYLMYATRGQVAQRKEVTDFIRTSGQEPDQQVDDLMSATIRAMSLRRGDQLGEGGA